MKLKYILEYFLLFVVLQVILLFALFKFYEDRSSSYNHEYIQNAKVKYNTSVNIFQVLTDTFYDNQSKYLASVMAEVEGASDEKKVQLREQLLDRYSDFYLNEKLHNMEVFHIFDKEGYTFLRFHKEDKFGDPVYRERFSLRNIKKNVISQTGLEVGIFKESFRFQFPLFYNGEFVGMYEYGMSFSALAHEMRIASGGEYYFLLKKEAVDSTASQEIVQKRYLRSSLSDGYYALKTLHNHKQSKYFIDALKQNSSVMKHLQRLQGTFTILFNVNEMPYRAVFLPINDIEGKHIAYYIVFGEGNHFKNTFLQIGILYLLLTLLMLGVLGYVYRVKANHSFVKSILDSQHDMIILTDGHDLKSVNKTVLDFFNYKTMDSFLKEHDCICDYFIEEEGFLAKEMEDQTWLEYLLANSEDKHKVKMFDYREQEERIFKLELKQYKDSTSYIVTLHDITQEELIKSELERGAHYDTLTKIYNRNRFDYFLEKELSRSARYGSKFSLIMFDIDHFKEVNDTYGHDVGDNILRELVKIIQNEIRDSDIFARWGGEEFMIIASTDVTSTEQFAQKLRRSIEFSEFSEVEKITCSFGVSAYREGDDAKSIVKRCDEMLYAAKHAGRNCVVSMM